MKLDIKVDFSALRDLDDKAVRVPRAAEKALHASGEVVLETKEGNIEPTYVRDIPKGRSGQPLWKRSLAWKLGQRLQKTALFERVVQTIGAAAKPIKSNPGGYEEKLGKLHSIRRNEAAADTRKEAEKPATAAFEITFADELEL